MSDLDTLLVTFQTQLSDVMETVVKTAMYEVTRLVEDGILEEVRRRGQEVESLRMQLQWTEKEIHVHGAKDGGKTGRCVACAKKGVELSTGPAKERSSDQRDDVLMGCVVKKEGGSVERWTGGHREEVTKETVDADSATSSPDRQSQATEEDESIPAVDVKEEVVNMPTCSSMHLEGWSGTLDGKAGLESPVTESQPKQTQECTEELLRNIIKQGPQISAAFSFSEELEETHMATDPTLEMVTSWTGLLQNHRLEPEKDHDPGKPRVSLKHTEHKLSESVTAHVHTLVNPGRENSASRDSKARVQNGEGLGVTIKQELTVESEEYEEGRCMEKKEMPKSGMRSFSCSIKQHRLSLAANKHNNIYHKTTVQDAKKLHPRLGTGFKLQAAVQHLNRPMKKNPTTASLSTAHSQAVNLNPLNRTPSTSKATPPSPLSAQRIHLGDKQAAALHRTVAPWVGIRSQYQSANSHHASPVSHPDSHTGGRHLLRCGQCGKCFPHPSNLKAHLLTHTGERPFCCSLCGRSFTKLSNLKAHRRVHTGERPYCCLACGKRFTQKCNLKRHQRIHLDV